MKIKLPYIVLLLSCFFSGTFFAQECEKVLLYGKVRDTLNPQSFYNLMLVNKKTGRGVFGQPDGSFSLYVKSGDSIVVSVKNYPLTTICVKADQNCQQKVSLYLIRRVQEVNTVYVRPLKSLAQIKEEREALALRDTKMVSGVDVLRSPITALYQAFSKKEKAKRWIAEQEFKDDQRKVVKELIRTYVAYDVIKLSEEDFDEFILFLNLDVDFLKTASEMDLIVFIKDKFDHFTALKKINLEEKPNWRFVIEKDPKEGMIELMRFCNAQQMIDLPESEFERFINFTNLQMVQVRSSSDYEVYQKIVESYKGYLKFYNIDLTLMKLNYLITDDDNEDWKWELKVKKDLKKATIILLNLYNQKKVIALNEDEYARFMNILNLKSEFMLSATNTELINYVREKYLTYIDFINKGK